MIYDNKKETITKPDIVLLLGLIVSLISLFAVKKYNYLVALYIILMFSIGSYNLHCVINGKCNIWSNIILISYIIYTTAIIYMLVFGKGTFGKLK